MNSEKIIFIVGPTAVGKSDVALEVADRLSGEIVSCDSMQIYKEINIASNKPDETTSKKIPHHLIDIISVKDDFDVARFNTLAVQAIEDIHKCGRIPVVVGGSGLYMQILLDGLFEGSPKKSNLRTELEQEIATLGSEAMHKRLEQKDPQAAVKIHANDSKRIVRALEVCELTNDTFSSLQKNRQGLWGKYDIALFALNRKREELYDIINRRVDLMVEQGLVEEIKALQSLQLSLTASRLIGVKEILGHLKGEYDLARAIYLMKLNTRHYAKRQLTWFRKEERLNWLEITETNTQQMIADQILKKGS